MCEDAALSCDRHKVLFENRQRNVSLRWFLAHVALADEEVGFGSGCDQCIGPFGIAGIGDRAPFSLDPISKTGAGAVVVTHVDRRGSEQADIIGATDLQLAKRQRKPSFNVRCARKSNFHGACEPIS